MYYNKTNLPVSFCLHLFDVTTRRATAVSVAASRYEVFMAVIHVTGDLLDS